MKLGQKPRQVWHPSAEIKGSFSRMNSQINRLLLLEKLWEKLAGGKAKFWQLYAVKSGIIYIKVDVMAARHELLIKERELIKELNKNFDKPWIKQISIV